MASVDACLGRVGRLHLPAFGRAFAGLDYARSQVLYTTRSWACRIAAA